MTVVDTRNAVQELQRRVRGAVIEPGRPGWEAATQAFNLSFVQEPTLVAVPEDERDVVAIVEYAKDDGLRVAPQRTGHNAAPLGDLSDSDPAQDRPAAGRLHRRRPHRPGALGREVGDGRAARVRDRARRAARLDARTSASSATRSAAGSAGTRASTAWPRTASRAIELVTADGELRRVDAEHEPELFWALRGGGGELRRRDRDRVRALPDRARSTPGVLFFPFERAARGAARVARVDADAAGRGHLGRPAAAVPAVRAVPEPLRGQSFVVVEAVVPRRARRTARR